MPNDPWIVSATAPATMVTPGVRKAHGQEIIDRGYQLLTFDF
jgi:hypothetical protein